jgi:phosphatidylserine decarboxylase
MISNFAAKLADCYLPPLIRSVVIYGLGTAFGVNFKDVMFSLEHFTSWNEFFGRKIIPRPIDKTQFALLAPADSKLLSLQEITEDSTILVKSIRYSVGNFLTGEFGKVYNEQDLAKLRFKKNTKLFSLVFYLAPKDYHRFHSMANCTVFERVHVGGLLYPVKDSYLEIVPGVYEVNERVTLKGEWKWGNLIQSYVGATNVGTIQINLDPELNTRHTIDGPIVNNKLIGVDLQAGEEVGRFLMGSSVVAIVEVPNDFVWEVTVGQDVKYGMRIGH